VKIRRFENNIGVTYVVETAKELDDLLETWKKEFREINKVDRNIELHGRDKSYERYCQGLEDLKSKFSEG